MMKKVIEKSVLHAVWVCKWGGRGAKKAIEEKTNIHIQSPLTFLYTHPFQ